MSELQTIVTSIAVKVRELADRQRSLISENEALTQLNEDLAKELAAQKNANSALIEQNKLAKIARSVSPDGEDRKEERKRLNDLVREIDKCIALLNN
jgi:regulator of replication initiation timing